MGEETHSASNLCIGLYNGATTLGHARLLYKSLLKHGSLYAISQATVLPTIEGSHAGRGFRTVENEVSSNELPLLLRFTGQPEAIQDFAHWALDEVQNDGIVVVDTAVSWWRPKWRPKCRPEQRKTKTQGVRSDTRTPELRTSPGLEVQICITEADHKDGKPIYQLVTAYLRNQGTTWVSTTRGVAGFGEERMYRSKWWGRGDVPMMIVAIDRAEQLESLLPDIGRLVGGHGVVVSRPVTLFRI